MPDGQCLRIPVGQGSKREIEAAVGNLVHQLRRAALGGLRDQLNLRPVAMEVRQQPGEIDQRERVHDPDPDGAAQSALDCGNRVARRVRRSEGAPGRGQQCAAGIGEFDAVGVSIEQPHP
ncbi:MAG: hypothetical protein QOJ78_2132 [Pseudonocardiales bacterium]|nr:hypothetical protein [Pseudonocardiales bacterium]